MNYISMPDLVDMYNLARNRNLNRQYFTIKAARGEIPPAVRIGTGRIGKHFMTAENAEKFILEYDAPLVGKRGKSKNHESM